MPYNKSYHKLQLISKIITNFLSTVKRYFIDKIKPLLDIFHKKTLRKPLSRVSLDHYFPRFKYGSPKLSNAYAKGEDKLPPPISALNKVLYSALLFYKMYRL